MLNQGSFGNTWQVGGPVSAVSAYFQKARGGFWWLIWVWNRNFDTEAVASSFSEYQYGTRCARN